MSLPVAAWLSDWSELVALCRREGITSAAMLEAFAADRARFRDARLHVHTLTMNPAAMELFGVRSAEEFIQYTAELPPEYAKWFALAASRVLFGEERTFTLEMPILRADGKPLDILLRLSRAEDIHASGDVMLIAIDMTERRNAERALIAASRYVDNLIAHANVLIVELDLDAHPRRLNRMGEEITGFTLDELRDRNWFATLAPAENQGTAAKLVAALREGRMPPGDEAPIVHRNGTRRVIAWRNTYVRDEHGTPTGIICFGLDVTEARRMQETLRRGETLSAMGNLVAGVAHEVRNPLFGISATLDAYAAELSRPGYEEFASALRSEVARLTVLMHELLQYGRPAELQVAPALLRDVVASAIKGPRVENAVPASLPPLLLDASRMRQVFENLIDNSMQLAPPNGTIRISASVDGDAVLCRIEDDGPGFADADLDRVFEPFFTRRHGGTGLGLSIVQRIVAEHGGRVTAANREGGGAVVTIQLPMGR